VKGPSCGPRYYNNIGVDRPGILPFNWMPSERKPVYLKKNWLNGQVRRSSRSAAWNLHTMKGILLEVK